MSNLNQTPPLVTIITVVYNGAALIEDTIKSILGQDYPHIEYIVIDGGSKDGTLEIINKYHGRITKIVSEKDKGIYDAMNKGLLLANGEWINFMNAGDRYFDQSTLSHCFSTGQLGLHDIIVGSTIVEFDGYSLAVKPGRPNDLWKGTQFCHQSSFIRTNLHQKIPYNLENRITADFEFFFKCFEKGSKFLYLDQTVAVYKAGGLSDQKNVKVAYSFFKTVYSSHKNLKVFAFYLKHISLVILKNLVKSVISKNLLKRIRSFRNN